MHMAGAITSDAADKAARFLQLCDAFGLPVVSLVDTPGMMVGPRPRRRGWCGTPRACCVAGAALRVPLVAVILRRGYGLGAQAMVGGSMHEPLLTVAWPSAHLGPMGLEGAVRLGLRKELEAIADEDEREQRVRELTAARAGEREGAQRRDALRDRRRDRPGRDPQSDRPNPRRRHTARPRSHTTPLRRRLVTSRVAGGVGTPLPKHSRAALGRSFWEGRPDPS